MFGNNLPPKRMWYLHAFFPYYEDNNMLLMYWRTLNTIARTSLS